MDQRMSAPQQTSPPKQIISTEELKINEEDGTIHIEYEGENFGCQQKMKTVVQQNEELQKRIEELDSALKMLE